MDDGARDLAILKTHSLASALELQLESLILSGELAPGMRLNEIHLAARFGTSRGPVREATRSLEAKGFVEVIRNRGVFVRDLSAEEVHEIYEVRGTLFALAGRLCCLSASAELFETLAGLIHDMDVAARANDIEAYYPLNLRFHSVILKASGNRLLTLEYQRFVNKMHLFRRKSLVQGGGLSVSNSEHKDILEALRSGDEDRAYLANWRHVSLAKQRMMTTIPER